MELPYILKNERENMSSAIHFQHEDISGLDIKNYRKCGE